MKKKRKVKKCLGESNIEMGELKLELEIGCLFARKYKREKENNDDKPDYIQPPRRARTILMTVPLVN